MFINTVALSGKMWHPLGAIGFPMVEASPRHIHCIFKRTKANACLEICKGAFLLKYFFLYKHNFTWQL